MTHDRLVFGVTIDPIDERRVDVLPCIVCVGNGASAWHGLRDIDAKRHHTSQNPAHEVIEEAREGLKKSELLRVLKIRELAQKATEIEAAGK